MGVMSKPAAPKYRTTNWPEHNAALKRRGSLEIWLDPQMHWLSKPCGRPGRPVRFSDSAIKLCLTLKALFSLPLRQVTGLVASLIKLAGLDWPVPDYTTLCRWQKTLMVELGGRPSSGGLRLLIDRRLRRSQTLAVSGLFWTRNSALLQGRILPRSSW